MVTNYGTEIHVTRADSEKRFDAICDTHGVIKSTKQSARAHHAARSHAVEFHGMRFDWAYDLENDHWAIDAPEQLQAIVFPLVSGEYGWAVMEPPTTESVTGTLDNGRSANKVAAQIMATLSIADILRG